MRGKGGYVGADGVPRLNVLDLQVLRHDSSVPSCLHATLLVLLFLLFCMLLALHTSKHQQIPTELGIKTHPKSSNA